MEKNTQKLERWKSDLLTLENIRMALSTIRHHKYFDVKQHFVLKYLTPFSYVHAVGIRILECGHKLSN